MTTNLAGFLDEYDRLTGRLGYRIVTDAELSELAERVSSSLVP